MHEDCIFCKIASGDVPCAKIYEDDATLAFMDIGPIVKGHALVIPRMHYDPLMNTPIGVLEKMIAVVQCIARAQVVSLGAEGINISQANGACAGQVVGHLHFHVIPRFKNDHHHWNWDAKSYESPDEMHMLAQKIQAAIPS